MQTPNLRSSLLSAITYLYKMGVNIWLREICSPESTIGHIKSTLCIFLDINMIYLKPHSQRVGINDNNSDHFFFSNLEELFWDDLLGFFKNLAYEIILGSFIFFWYIFLRFNIQYDPLIIIFKNRWYSTLFLKALLRLCLMSVWKTGATSIWPPLPLLKLQSIQNGSLSV